MTAVMTGSRSGQAATLNGPSTLQVIQFLSQPTSVALVELLPQLWAEATPEDAENGYSQQARILAAILNRHVNAFAVSDAMEACAAISRIQAGNCLVEMYGVANTDQNRDRCLDDEQMNLNVAATALGGKL